jgi:hypothetical protein
MKQARHVRVLPSYVSRQRGASLLGMMIVVAIALSVAIVGLRVVPTVVEFLAAKRAIQRIADGPARSPLDIAKSFDEMAAVDDISAIAGRDLRIERSPLGVTISFAYEKRVALIGRVSLLIDYDASVAATN